MTKSYELVKKLYKNVNGKPFEMTPSQCELFDLIFKKKYPRNHVMTYTQFGKSDIVAMAVLTRASTFAEPWAIIAPTKDKTKIIMGYIIQHTFDNPYTLKRLEIADGESLERIRRERSKNKLTFKVEEGFGEVYVLSAQAGRVTSVESALMGFGCIFKGNDILTDEGYIPVEELFENKATDLVYSYNHKTKKVELKKILDFQKNPVGKRKKVIIDLGDRTIECTDDHPVYVEDKGYIKAKHIKRGDTVCVVD